MKPILLNEIPDSIKERIGSVDSMTFPRQGWTSDVAILGDFVLKRVRDEQFRSWIADEVRILKILNTETTLPVPKIYTFIEENDQSWGLFEKLPGETLFAALARLISQNDRESYIYEFGKSLKRLHLTPCPEALRSEAPWLNRMLKRAEYHLENYEVEGNEELLDRLKKQLPDSVSLALIHGDFTIDNVLVMNGGVSAVIDWSGGDFGDPRYDVSLAVRKFSPNEQAIFYEGYGGKIISENDFNYFNNGLYAFF